MLVPANHLDFLEVLDRHTRESPVGEVSAGDGMHSLADEAGLVSWGDASAARWTGELVALGYVRPLSRAPGIRDIPPAVPWSDRELYSFYRYQVTPAGRDEADRIRRRRREAGTDAALGERLPLLDHAWLTEPQRAAVGQPLHDLRAALDGGRNAAAIGAAKDLAEAACKVVLAHAGAQVTKGASLPTLFKQALVAASPLGTSAPGSELGRGLAATVQRLAELRNAAGAGHGRAAAADVDAAHARLAAAAASAVADFLLSSVVTRVQRRYPKTW